MTPMHPPRQSRMRSRRAIARTAPRRQRGQALVYGLFVLISGLAALFYLFNVGQLSHEKTRLVNTADAVALSGGLIEARSMNFAAYTNRALVANEVAIAQAVSMASWLAYMESHGQTAIGFDCFPNPIRSVPFAVLQLFRYALTSCLGLAAAEMGGFTPTTRGAFQAIVPPLMAATEVVKTALQAATAVLPVLSLAARSQVMDQVAQANYRNLGQVEVSKQLESSVLLRDDYLQYGAGDTRRMAMERFTRNDEQGDRRKRMADMAVRSVRMDGFTP